MEGIIAIIIIVISLITSANKAKQVKQNAPGQSAAPQNAPTQPVYPQSAPNRPVQTGGFAKQVAPNRPVPIKTNLPAGHRAVGNMDEGISRECEHGSLGGSMAYESHEGGSRVQRAQTAYDRQNETSLYRPAMTAQEMRKAVVMAEILKRPQERMAEQARRWSAR